jgi:transposase-like protein/IS1 family transposase
LSGFSAPKVKEPEMKCPFCGSENHKVHQRNHHACNTIYRCLGCNRCFSERRFSPYAGLKLAPEKIVSVLHSLCEGVTVRATERLVNVNRDTVLRLLVMAGERARNVLDRYVRDLRPRYVQADELWTFVHTKEAHKDDDDPAEWGDAYIWLALDSESKLLISHLVGKRDAASAHVFVRDFSERVHPMWRCQFTSDGFKPYIEAVESAFGSDIDYGMLLKMYGKPDNAGPDWYGPAKVIATVPTPVSGDPELHRISTSHIERTNLSFRTQLRRFTRLALGFSKSLDNLKAAVTLYVAYYNLCRVHRTLRVTPAQEAGLTDHIWSIEELLREGCAEQQAA